jgi:hypothetical protein
MMSVSATTGVLSGSLQTLVDSRLDTIDRMLLGRVPRQDRLAIVREVESQIFDLLGEREGQDIDRDDVLAVLARLDPPEAYLPDVEGEAQAEPLAPRRPAAHRAGRASTAPKGDPRVARASGILGLSALGLVMLSPLIYLAVGLIGSGASEAVLFLLCFGVLGLIFVGGVLGLVLGIYARLSGVWAVVGVVTSVLALLFSFAAGALLLLELMG